MFQLIDFAEMNKSKKNLDSTQKGIRSYKEDKEYALPFCALEQIINGYQQISRTNDTWCWWLNALYLTENDRTLIKPINLKRFDCNGCCHIFIYKHWYRKIKNCKI